MKHKVRIVTNNKGSGDYACVYIDDMVGRSGHSISLHDWEFMLNFMGVDVKLVHLDDEDFDDPLFNFDAVQ